MPPAKFAVGDLVHRANQPEQVGEVLEPRWNDSAKAWDYFVRIDGRRRIIPELALVRLANDKSPWEAAKEGLFSGHRHFLFTLTYHRLRRPPARIAHSFATARTQFYPHQFKPLLKFLDHPEKRILIADDVGLGKTIEAGYILRELQARQDVRRVLVVVPARLTSKWKRELEQRFSERFDIVRRDELIGLARAYEREREPDPFRWITSYESIRPEVIRDAYDKTRPAFDAVILDEAHRVRNVNTLQHKVAEILCACADTAVFLTATPVQNSLEDLYNLVRLLAPDQFFDYGLFEVQMEGNKHLFQAQQALVLNPPDAVGAAKALERFLSGRAGKAFRKTTEPILDRLKTGGLARRDVIELQTDIGRLSPTGHIISRTRKAEAMPNRAQREAGWWEVTLTQEEKDFHDTILGLCQTAFGSADSWAMQMSTLMALRMAASCIPAAASYFADRLQASPATANEVEEGEVDPAEDEASEPKRLADISEWSGDYRNRLSSAVRGISSGLADTKLSDFLKALDKIWKEDSEIGRERRKVVVFSFFRRTLDYLQASLRNLKIGCRKIHGGVPVDEREVAIDEFLENAKVLVLLTSEVGGEGIDLQKASVVVNYDLPWNPMVVEQRIGRVDRIGQTAERIVVLNFVLKGSVEDRILRRLLDKISVFQAAVGDLDPIVGSKIEELQKAFFSGQLTEEQLERRIKESEEAFQQQIDQAHHMLSRVDGLLAADQALVDEINAVVGERQIPSDKELLIFLNAYLAKRFKGVQIPLKAAEKPVSVSLSSDFEVALAEAAANVGEDGSRFARRISLGAFPVTTSREVAYHHPGVEFLHLRHPLVRLAMHHTACDALPATAFCIGLSRSKVLPAGTWFFYCNLLEVQGATTLYRFAAAFASASGAAVISDLEITNRAVVEMLECADDREPPTFDPAVVDGARNALLDSIDRLVADMGAHEEQRNRVRHERQRAALVSMAELRRTRAERRLRQLEQKKAAPFALRMATAGLAKADKEHAAAQASAVTPVWRGVERDEIAMGVLIVDKGVRVGH